MRDTNYPIRRFPRDQEMWDSVLLARTTVRGNDGAVQSLYELLRTQSSRLSNTVSITSGKTTVVISAENAIGLARALLEHADHLGEAARYLMVDERRIERP